MQLLFTVNDSTFTWLCPGLGAVCWGGGWLPVGVVEGWGWWMEPEWCWNDWAERQTEPEPDEQQRREATHTYCCTLCRDLHQIWLTGALLTVHGLLWPRLALSLAGVLARMTHLLMRRPGRQHPRTSLQHRVNRLETARDTQERFLKAKYFINTSALKRLII